MGNLGDESELKPLLTRIVSLLKSGVFYAIIGLALLSCDTKLVKRELIEPGDVPKISYIKNLDYLKAHMKNGNVFIFNSWKIDKNNISGDGQLLDPFRAVVDSGYFEMIPVDSVAIFETNKLKTSPAIGFLTFMTLTSAVITAVCIANPKACFGSCPTFYVSDGKEEILQAEGFSSSIAPILEKRDIDALYRAKPVGDHVEITMRNEALETHVVRYVRLLAAPGREGSRVMVTSDGDFWECDRFVSPLRFSTEGGDYLDMIREFDRNEYYSETDSSDLAARETIEMEFPELPAGKYGLVISSRQSLLSTYLLYQTLAYMGTNVGEWVAALERSDPELRDRLPVIANVLGNIDVLVPGDSGQWIKTGHSGETGPLATDTRIVPLSWPDDSPRRVRLNMTRGNWRIDYVALARLAGRVEPVRIEPSYVWRGDVPDEQSRLILLDTVSALTTFPGDNYKMRFDLPDETLEYEYFLESKGYYLEWIRQEWLAEENPASAAMMVLNTREALRKLAGEFKMVEAEMEEVFWNSKYEAK